MTFGLASASAAAADGAGAAAATIRLREGRELRVRMDDDGVRVVAEAGAPAAAPGVYDCVNSLLLNVSPAFAAAFNGSLAAALQAAVDERAREDDS